MSIQLSSPSMSNNTGIVSETSRDYYKNSQPLSSPSVSKSGSIVSEMCREYYKDSQPTGRCDAVCHYARRWAAGFAGLPTSKKVAVIVGNAGLAFGWVNSLIGSYYMGNEQIDSVIVKREGLTADFFHPFGEWSGQLATYFLAGSALNYYVKYRGSYQVEMDRMKKTIEKNLTNVTTVREFVDLAEWVKKELHLLNSKAFDNRSEFDLRIDVYNVLKPLVDQMDTLDDEGGLTLAQKNMLVEIGIAPAIRRLQDALKNKDNWMKITIGEQEDRRQPCATTSRIIYGFLLGPVVLVCGAGVFAGAGTGFYEAIANQVWTALGHTGEWSVAGASAIFIFNKIRGVFFKNAGVFYNTKEICQATLSEEIFDKVPLGIKSEDLQKGFLDFCESYLGKLSRDCWEHKDARNVSLKEIGYGEVMQSTDLIVSIDSEEKKSAE